VQGDLPIRRFPRCFVPLIDRRFSKAHGGVPPSLLPLLRGTFRILACLLVLTTALFSPGLPHASADSGLCAIPGKDGPGGTLAGVVNTYYPGTASAPAGSTSIPVGAPEGSATLISSGDLLLIIQM
jgi:hypothetical protein